MEAKALHRRMLESKFMKAAEVETRREHESFFTTTYHSLINWARKSSLWPYPFGTACCAIEFMATVSSHYDIARFGSEVVRFSPKQSDVLMVLGTINDQMAEPKWVISMGACATCGGFYRAYHVMQGIDEIIPVDVYIPGCPPTPEAVLDAIIKLQEQVENDKRLSYERHPSQTRLKTPEIDATVHGLEGPPRSLVRFLEENQDAQGPIAQAFKERFPTELIQDGILPPIGEVYSYWEAANGELGFYLISDGGKRPYRLRCRGACFYVFQAFNRMVKGGYLSDAVAALGSLNVVAGELEK